MNSDYFGKHNSSKHNGLCASKVLVEPAQTTLKFKKKRLNLFNCTIRKTIIIIIIIENLIRYVRIFKKVSLGSLYN